jgi:hypothetical protein
MTGGRKSLLFVNKKKQKNFIPLPVSATATFRIEVPAYITIEQIKFFCFFLFTKRRILHPALSALSP